MFVFRDEGGFESRCRDSGVEFKVRGCSMFKYALSSLLPTAFVLHPLQPEELAAGRRVVESLETDGEGNRGRGGKRHWIYSRPGSCLTYHSAAARTRIIAAGSQLHYYSIHISHSIYNIL